MPCVKAIYNLQSTETVVCSSSFKYFLFLGDQTEWLHERPFYRERKLCRNNHSELI